MRISDWSSAVCSSDLGTFLLDGARRYVPAYAGLAVGQRTQHRAFIAGLGTIRARVRSADLRTDPSTREDRPAQRRAKLKTQAVARVQIAQRARLQADPAEEREARKTVERKTVVGGTQMSVRGALGWRRATKNNKNKFKTGSE